MSRAGFRFVHATGLCLDEPLVGAGELTREDRELAEDATFRAWDGVVQACLSAQVEFLLLTGNSFSARTRSLRARVALEAGFEKLAEHDISVFIAPGTLDPAPAWKQWEPLPPNVTLLCDEEHEPVAVMRDQRVLAAIFVVATADADESRWSANGPPALHRAQAPFRIGLLPAGAPVDFVEGHPQPRHGTNVAQAAVTLLQAALKNQTNYLALGEGRPLTTRSGGSTLHDPGAAQSLSAATTGSRGCSLIDVSAKGDVTISPVATAPVRWESIPLSIERHVNWNDVAERMALAVMERPTAEGERLWILHWRITGAGKVFDALTDDAASRRKLLDLLEAELAGEEEVRRVHRFDYGGPPPVAEQAPPSENSTDLFTELTLLLNSQSSAAVEQARRELQEVALLQSPDLRSVRELIQQMDGGVIVERARHLAGQWLS